MGGDALQCVKYGYQTGARPLRSVLLAGCSCLGRDFHHRGWRLGGGGGLPRAGANRCYIPGGGKVVRKLQARGRSAAAEANSNHGLAGGDERRIGFILFLAFRRSGFPCNMLFVVTRRMGARDIYPRCPVWACHMRVPAVRLPPPLFSFQVLSSCFVPPSALGSLQSDHFARVRSSLLVSPGVSPWPLPISITHPRAYARTLHEVHEDNASRNPPQDQWQQPGVKPPLPTPLDYGHAWRELTHPHPAPS